jgi:hypothetical protein
MNHRNLLVSYESRLEHSEAASTVRLTVVMLLLVLLPPMQTPCQSLVVSISPRARVRA